MSAPSTHIEEVVTKNNQKLFLLKFDLASYTVHVICADPVGCMETKLKKYKYMLCPVR
jgi:hypothetical protein